MRYIISLFLHPFSGANLRCFFVSLLLYSRSLLDKNNSPTVRSPITDTLAMVLSDSHSIGGEIMASERPSSKIFPRFPLHIRAITGGRNDRLSLYFLCFYRMAILRDFCFKGTRGVCANYQTRK